MAQMAGYNNNKPTTKSNERHIINLWDRVNQLEKDNEIVIKEEVKMDDWKDLDIKDIPTDFFEANYEIQVLVEHHDSIDKSWHSEWVTVGMSFKERLYFIEQQKKAEKVIYRYRLKPLESMTMTKKVYEDLTTYSTNLAVGDEIEYEGRIIRIII